MVDKEDNLCIARLAEQAERYNEMVDAMNTIAKMGVGLTQEERNLFSVAYKNVTGALRASWRIVLRHETEKKEKNDYDGELTEHYRKRIEKELRDVCEDVLHLLENDLIPSANLSVNVERGDDNEGNASYVFYYKMKGDYLRYMAEVSTGNERKDASEKAQTAYETASEKAATNLPATHPIRLGMALNFSVYLYEILNSPERACKSAKQAFDNAVAELDSLTEDSYKDTTLIMQLLRDNLTLWTSDMQDSDIVETDA